MKKRNGGFTLLEMMVTIAIIGVLTGLVTQALPFLKELTRDKRRIYELSNLKRQIELFRNENGAYPVGPTEANFLRSDALSSYYGGTVSQNYIPGMVPNYFNELPQDPLPGPSSISLCESMGMQRNIAYFSNGEYYKLIYNCSSETENYGPDLFYDPSRADMAWSISNDMEYTTWSLGW